MTNWADVLTGTLAGAVAQLDPERPPEGLGRLVLMFVLALAVTAPFAVRTVRKVRAGTWGRRGGAADDATTDDAPEDVPEETDEARLEDLIDAIKVPFSPAEADALLTEYPTLVHQIIAFSDADENFIRPCGAAASNG